MSHPAERYEASIAQVQQRAKLALGALGVTLVHRVLSAGVTLWQNTLTDGKHPMETLTLSDTLVSWMAIAMLVLLVVTATLFIRWMRLAVSLTRALSDGVKWKPSDATWAFFIPFVNIVRPYEIMRDTASALEPERLPEPPVQAVADASTGYRDVKITAPPPPIKVSPASIGAWWAAWWIGNVLGNISARLNGETVDAIVTHNWVYATSDVVDVFSAIFAMRVVRGVTERILERHRRVRYTPVEQLQAANIAIGDVVL